MTTRLAFHGELRRLEDSLVGMADTVSNAIQESVAALQQRDTDLARHIVDADDDVNSRYGDIERGVMELIATQQPMATDLREILAISAIATDLERIGDHAKGIARITMRLGDDPQLDPGVRISRMAELTSELQSGVIDAFVHRDAEAASRVAARDDELDDLYEDIYRSLLETMMTDRTVIEAAGRQLWVAKSLERVGDHVTNIAERVVFVVTGEIVELNP